VTEHLQLFTEYGKPARRNRAGKRARDARYRAANRDKERARNARYYAANADKVRAGRRRHVVGCYGLSVADYDALLATQGGACALCGTASTRSLHVDHDHACCPGRTACGRCVRGLLCQRCNTHLGIGERIPNLLAAVEREYLRDPPARRLP
jgi:hypothetical protein